MVAIKKDKKRKYPDKLSFLLLHNLNRQKINNKQMLHLKNLGSLRLLYLLMLDSKQTIQYEENYEKETSCVIIFKFA